jgi:hypothetical protein
MSDKQTNIEEVVKEKAAQLSEKHGCKVFPLIFKLDSADENVIGYIKEPPRFVKLRIMDKGLTNPVSSASEVVDAYLIKEESDPRIYSEASENDAYYLGATLEAYNLIVLAVNQFKKK